MRSIPLIAALGLLTSGSAVLAKRDMNKLPEVVETGKPISCIPLHHIRESRVRNDQVIDFRVSGKRWYRNTLPHKCPSLGFEQRYSHRTSMNQLCSTDIITVLYSAPIHQGASCGLGKFQPVEMVKR